MRHKGCASLGLWAFALLGGAAAAARAAPLQLQGELTITNRTDELDPSSALFNLPGGREFTFSVLGDPGGFDPLELLGETTLAPAFWPDPGFTFTGPIVLDFMSVGAGLIQENPLRADGQQLLLDLVALLGPQVGRFRGIGNGPALAPEALGTPQAFELNELHATSIGDVLGDGVLRIDAIVPEPATSLSLLVVAAGVACARRRARRVRTQR